MYEIKQTVIIGEKKGETLVHDSSRKFYFSEVQSVPRLLTYFC